MLTADVIQNGRRNPAKHIYGTTSVNTDHVEWFHPPRSLDLPTLFDDNIDYIGSKSQLRIKDPCATEPGPLFTKW